MSMPVLVLVLIDVSAMRLILYLTKTIEGSNSLRYSNFIKKSIRTVVVLVILVLYLFGVRSIPNLAIWHTITG